MSRPAPILSGGGSERASFGDLSISKFLDKASPLLMLHCANGARINTADLVVSKQVGDKSSIEYIKIRLENIMVTSVSTSASDGGDPPTEDVTLNFSKITFIYTPQDPNTGAPGTPIEFSWDIARNEPG